MNTLKTFFYSLKRSMLDLNYYKDVADASFGFSLKYLWFLLLILTIVKAITFAGAYIYARPTVTPAVNRAVSYAQNLYPPDLKIKVQDGQLSTNVKEPFIFDLDQNYKTGSNRHLLIIDTTGTIENYPYYNTYVLATRNAVVYPSKSERDQIQETSVFYFRNLKNDIAVDRKIYDDIIGKIRPFAAKAVVFVDWFVAAGLLMFLILGSFGWTMAILFALLFMTAVVWAVSMIFRKGYGYQPLYRMGMHAVTWPILLEQAIKYFHLPVPNIFFLVFVVFMTAVIFTNKNKVVAKRKVKSKSK